ncbi:MAG: hypothetical protein KGI97_07730 [Alphaproteobacteria bacterium]|nr:hypothetical protein [Alphaproteobacteria bacterium]
MTPDGRVQAKDSLLKPLTASAIEKLAGEGIVFDGDEKGKEAAGALVGYWLDLLAADKKFHYKMFPAPRGVDASLPVLGR